MLDRATGALEMRVPIEEGRPENRANDIKVDGKGRAWVGTMAFDKRPRNAALYRVDGETVTRVVDELTISNGPAFDEPRGRLYLAETGLCIVDVFDLDSATGALSARRRFLDLSRRAALARRDDRRRRGHALGCRGTSRSGPSLPHRRHA